MKNIEIIETKSPVDYKYALDFMEKKIPLIKYQRQKALKLKMKN